MLYGHVIEEIVLVQLYCREHILCCLQLLVVLQMLQTLLTFHAIFSSLDEIFQLLHSCLSLTNRDLQVAF